MVGFMLQVTAMLSEKRKEKGRRRLDASMRICKCVEKKGVESIRKMWDPYPSRSAIRTARSVRW